MTIHEVETRFKFGPFKIGKKIGDPVPNHGALFRYSGMIHENAGESWFARLLYKIPIISLPFAWWSEARHSFKVIARQPNEVELKGSRSPWCQDCNQQIVGGEINRHPLISKVLYYED